MTDRTQNFSLKHSTKVIEFYLRDLDTKVKEFLDLHKNEEFLLKLYWHEYRDEQGKKHILDDEEAL